MSAPCAPELLSHASEHPLSRRIEVELTSKRTDGSWTWRAAGAKQPKGEIEPMVVPNGAAVGDVLRVEADFEVDGIFVTKVLPAKHRSGRAEPQRIELLGVGTSDSSLSNGGVTARLTRKDKPKRDGRKSKSKRDRRDEAGGPDRRGAADRDADDGRTARKRRDGRRTDGQQRSSVRRRDDQRSSLPPRPRAKRLRPGRKHRDAWVKSLPPEQQAIAEVLKRGGLAAVRQHLTEGATGSAASSAPDAGPTDAGPTDAGATDAGPTDAGATDAGPTDAGPPASLGPGNPDELLALAERLLGDLQHAEWRDRADAALGGPEDVDLRDLRSVLVAADDHARDAETREIAEQLRVRLGDRVEATQVAWHDELRALLKDGRVVRALNVSSHNPKAGAPLPPEIARDLTAQTNSALGAGVSERRLSTVLEAASYSPIRPYVVVASPPEKPGDELLATARKIARRMPEVAASLGFAPATPSAEEPSAEEPSAEEPSAEEPSAEETAEASEPAETPESSEPAETPESSEPAETQAIS